MGQLKQMLLCTAYIGTGITAVVALLFREKPKSPPSKIAEIPRLDYKRSLFDSLKNWNLMWAMLTMSTSAGVSIAWVSCMEPMLKPLGVSQSQISYLLSIVMGVGFVVSLVTSFFIHKSKKYKFWLFFLRIYCELLPAGDYILCTYAKRDVDLRAAAAFDGGRRRARIDVV
jgi:fucose permease